MDARISFGVMVEIIAEKYSTEHNCLPLRPCDCCATISVHSRFEVTERLKMTQHEDAAAQKSNWLDRFLRNPVNAFSLAVGVLGVMLSIYFYVQGLSHRLLGFA
jgi:hypothetical protein